MVTGKEANGGDPIMMPRSVVHLEAPIGSSTFDIFTENMDAIQLLGCAEMLHSLGMMALAADHASQMTQHDKPQINHHGGLHLPGRSS